LPRDTSITLLRRKRKSNLKGKTHAMEPASEAGTLDPKKEAAIAALLTQRNVEEAARSIDISPSTLFRWLKEPYFHAAYLEARRAGYTQSIARLQQATGAAVSTLLKVMVDPSTPAATKVRAAHSVLEHSAKAIEIEEIEARVARLERDVDQSKP
jgi:transposase-like protein